MTKTPLDLKASQKPVQSISDKDEEMEPEFGFFFSEPLIIPNITNLTGQKGWGFLKC